MRTVRNILTVVAVSAFLFACEAEDYANEDDTLIEVRGENEEINVENNEPIEGQDKR